VPSAKKGKIDPDELLASKRKSTGVKCSFQQMRAKLPPDLADAITRWLQTDPTEHSSAAIAAAISDFAETYELDFSTATSDQMVSRHRPRSDIGRKCVTCQR
jgi:hypothetical protein